MGSRTEARPVASGRIPEARALEFGLALSAFSFVLLDADPLADIHNVDKIAGVMVRGHWLSPKDLKVMRDNLGSLLAV